MTDQQKGESKSLGDYGVPFVVESSIRKPPIQADNFEINPTIILIIQTSVQFGGFPNDDPVAHIVDFLEICETFKYNGVSDDAIRQRNLSFLT